MTTVRQVFAGAGLAPHGRVRWGAEVPLGTPGVYAVALTADIDDSSAMANCPIDEPAVGSLLQVRPEIAVDGIPATEESLTSRLASMWLSSEVVLYIGLAGTSLNTRVSQYYKTPLGARSPHAGGWPLKMLSNLDDLWVHYASCVDPNQAEIDMVGAFLGGVPNDVATMSCDSDCPIPFANLEVPGGRRKRHGVSGAKAPRLTPTTPRSTAVTPPNASEVLQPFDRSRRSRLQTQRVTANDINGGRIRIPRDSKSAFPNGREQVHIELRGESLICRWDPRIGPDQERSGVVGVAKAVLQRLVRIDERLTITPTDSGVRFD
jgi:hypothetical protein